MSAVNLHSTALSPESEPELACIVPLGPESEPELFGERACGTIYGIHVRALLLLFLDSETAITNRSFEVAGTPGRKDGLPCPALKYLQRGFMRQSWCVQCSSAAQISYERLQLTSTRPHHHTPSQVKDDLGAGTLLRHPWRAFRTPWKDTK